MFGRVSNIWLIGVYVTFDLIIISSRFVLHMVYVCVCNYVNIFVTAVSRVSPVTLRGSMPSPPQRNEDIIFFSVYQIQLRIFYVKLCCRLNPDIIFFLFFLKRNLEHRLLPSLPSLGVGVLFLKSLQFLSDLFLVIFPHPHPPLRDFHEICPGQVSTKQASCCEYILIWS